MEKTEMGEPMWSERVLSHYVVIRGLPRASR